MLSRIARFTYTRPSTSKTFIFGSSLKPKYAGDARDGGIDLDGVDLRIRQQFAQGGRNRAAAEADDEDALRRSVP